jgi:hypothetical protein
MSISPPKPANKGGRPKGTKLKKKDFMDYAYDQLGGKKAYAKWAEANPDDFYKAYTTKKVAKPPEDEQPRGTIRINMNIMGEKNGDTAGN